VPVVEIVVTPDIKSTEESGIAPETVSKSKKKSKKKSANKSTEPEMPVAVETTIETQEVSASPPFVEIEVPENKEIEVKEEGKFSILKLATFVN
jgi:hypothetical protein